MYVLVLMLIDLNAAEYLFSQNICVSPSILLLIFINSVQTEVLSATVKLKSKQDDSVYLSLYLL